MADCLEADHIRAILRDTVSADGQTRQNAWQKLHEIGGPAVEVLIEAVKEPGELRKLFVYDDNSFMQALAVDNAEAVAPLIVALHDDDTKIREFAACALAATHDLRALDPLVAALDDDDIRRTAAFALGRLGDRRAYEPLIAALQDKNPRVRSSVATALGRIGDLRAFDHLLMMLGDPEESARFGAVNGLGRLGDPRACEHLSEQAENDSSSMVRKEAARALKKLSVQP